jgi:hypothetical protein
MGIHNGSFLVYYSVYSNNEYCGFVDVSEERGVGVFVDSYQLSVISWQLSVIRLGGECQNYDWWDWDD